MVIFIKVKVGEKGKRMPSKWTYHSGNNMGDILELLKARHTFALNNRKGFRDWTRVQIQACSEAEYRKHTHPQFQL